MTTYMLWNVAVNLIVLSSELDVRQMVYLYQGLRKHSQVRFPKSQKLFLIHYKRIQLRRSLLTKASKLSSTSPSHGVRV